MGCSASSLPATLSKRDSADDFFNTTQHDNKLKKVSYVKTDSTFKQDIPFPISKYDSPLSAILSSSSHLRSYCFTITL